jgi:hypothetical protein
VEEKLGTVSAVTETEVTIAMDDGSTSVVPAPDMILIAAGMRVRVIDTGDGKPIYAWGQ